MFIEINFGHKKKKVRKSSFHTNFRQKERRQENFFFSLSYKLLIGVKERKKKEEKKYTEKLKNVTIDMIKSKKKCSENKREKLSIYL